MFPKLKAVRSWVNSMTAIQRVRQLESEVNEGENSGRESLRERGEIIRGCSDCRFYQPCEDHMEAFRR